MIEIEYFRGIKHKLDLDFLHGKELKSIGIYGRNGSGKSSIVDGWEWMSSNVHRIGHLSREGVSEKDYPHKLCNSQECYLKIDFETDSTKTFKFVFNHKLTTQPKINGDYDLFKSFIKYPCHLRFGDLREFVYFTKAQKYEYLGKLLGLDDPLIVQGQLFSFLNKLKVWLESLNEESVKNESKLTDILNIDGYEEIELIKKKNDIAKKYEFPETDNLKDFKWLLDNLTELMSKDPITQKLFDWKEIQVIINSFYPITSIKDNLESLEEYYTKVKANEESIKAIALIKLYETGKSIIEKNEDKDICPLCDRPFEGDLLSHIELKHGELQELTNNKKKYDSMREEIRKVLEKLKYKIKVIENYKNKEIKKDLKSFFDFFDGLNSKNETSLSFVGKDIVETKEVEVLLKEVNEIITNLKLIEDEINNFINNKISELSDNEKRKELSSTVVLINNLYNYYRDYKINQLKGNYIERYKKEYEKIYYAYITWIQSSITNTFDKISNDVVNYFMILEESKKEIYSNPRLELMLDKNKAIELEIDFINECQKPAFKILSESQINSLGVSIFLACIKHFNPEFKFIIFDDIINSFDIHKRDKIIELIQEYFSDYQFLLMTHDDIWFEKLKNNFTDWNFKKFYGWDYTTGPKVKVEKRILIEIDEALKEDKTLEAGQKLGRYLEEVLQNILHNIHSRVQYKKDNSYVLYELFEAFKNRIFEKVDTTENLYKELEIFSKKQIFRNYMMHYKDIATSFTPEEIKNIKDNWEKIESLIKCKDCKKFMVYDKDQTKSIKCPKCSNGLKKK